MRESRMSLRYTTKQWSMYALVTSPLHQHLDLPRIILHLGPTKWVEERRRGGTCEDRNDCDFSFLFSFLQNSARGKRKDGRVKSTRHDSLIHFCFSGMKALLLGVCEVVMGF